MRHNIARKKGAEAAGAGGGPDARGGGPREAAGHGGANPLGKAEVCVCVCACVCVCVVCLSVCAHLPASLCLPVAMCVGMHASKQLPPKLFHTIESNAGL